MSRNPVDRGSARLHRHAAGPQRITRALAIGRMRARLLREGFPRVQMFILVSLTGLAGFGASAAMLAAGVDSMALRYLLAMGIAYIVFLGLLWLWLRTTAADWLDGVSPDWGDGHAPAGRAADVDGAGGTFDGGGASANVDFGSSDKGLDAIADKPFEAVAAADEGAIPLALLLLALGVVLSSLFVVWTAPALFAEILVDALLAAGLYRQLRALEPRHWMRTAVKRTLIPFILTTLVVTGAGFAMQVAHPQARSLGDVVMHR